VVQVVLLVPSEQLVGRVVQALFSNLKPGVLQEVTALLVPPVQVLAPEREQAVQTGAVPVEFK